MIRTKTAHNTKANTKGAKVPTTGSGAPNNFFGKHSSSTIHPSKVKSSVKSPVYGRKSGSQKIRSTGGC